MTFLDPTLEIAETALTGLEELGADFVSRLRSELEVTTPVNSSAIASITYQIDRTLIVEFTDGSEYDIPNFPPAVLREWLAAPSKGRFWNTNVRGRYG
jgi:KTSC domain